jgi:cytochrome c oxidase subunit 2
VISPPRIWWKPLGRLERTWLIIAFVWCVFLTAMMPLWYFMGRQNVPATTYRVTPAQFQALTDTFAQAHKVGEERGIPVVEAPPGDVYLYGRQFMWYPILKLKRGEEYRLHLSSLDVGHGFSLQPANLNFQVMPGYDYVVTVTPTEAGEFSIVCNEFCSLGHHVMVGKLYVTE